MQVARCILFSFARMYHVFFHTLRKLLGRVERVNKTYNFIKICWTLSYALQVACCTFFILFYFSFVRVYLNFFHNLRKILGITSSSTFCCSATASLQVSSNND
jgi:hypothetical protein